MQNAELTCLPLRTKPRGRARECNAIFYDGYSMRKWSHADKSYWSYLSRLDGK